ncbi:hypothetical protein [Streptomyces sp. NPDC045369]|uniref:hypothetical protein n=1 Tax=Streptomyces sp. NPDC045369 TaxID=3155732 RepID=UPI0034076B20
MSHPTIHPGGRTRCVFPARTACWPTMAPRAARRWQHGDELRARAILWRLLGVGATANRRDQ